MVIRGRVAEGIKESGFFTGLPWVREQFISRLGIDPYPGTLNLEVAGVGLVKLKRLKTLEGITIVPPDSKFCAAKCFPVVVGGKVKGALVIPLVPGYPESKMEIVAAEHIRDALGLEFGDMVQVRIINLNKTLRQAQGKL